MIDLKFVFSNIRCDAVKKSMPNRVKTPVVKNTQEEINNSEAPAKKKEIPLFYEHKIRAPKYELF